MALPQSHLSSSIFSPGTKVQVGSHRVVVTRYLSEGGFAHVYLVNVPGEGNAPYNAVLKRVVVPGKDELMEMRTEVETMKKLRGHKQIVQYIDSHACSTNSGYEVFLLMEYCNCGGLIDFMNTRLQDRLREEEILHIFDNVSLGLAAMHYLDPPLLHRDLKVENVLMNKSSTRGVSYKLCDFGSAAPPRPAAKTAQEGRIIEDDIQRHTTVQYRAPEMIDVYRKRPIDEKSDIWALGCLLYKLCYYTTPFEEQGPIAILNASFKFPSLPRFSDRLKTLIAMMLQEDPNKRPNIYKICREVSLMRGTQFTLKDIYSNRTASEARKNQELPTPPTPVLSPPPSAAAVGASKFTPQPEITSLPTIVPMRRGRPTNEATPSNATPSDPFASLDSSSQYPRIDQSMIDAANAKFPSLDDFGLLHDRGEKFAFDSPTVPQAQTATTAKPLNQRVSEALADEAFGMSSFATKPTISRPSSAVPKLTQTATPSSTSPPKSVATRKADLDKQIQNSTSMTLESPVKTSTKNETSSTAPAVTAPKPLGRFTPFSTLTRSISQSKRSVSSEDRERAKDAERPGLFSRKKTDYGLNSSRPSLLRTKSNVAETTQGEEGKALPAPSPVDSASLPTRSKSVAVRLSSQNHDEQSGQQTSTSTTPPSKHHLFPHPHLHHHNHNHHNHNRHASRSRDPSKSPLVKPHDSSAVLEDKTLLELGSPTIESNVDFLRTMEDESHSRLQIHKRSSSQHTLNRSKRSSMPIMPSLSSGKGLLAGRFSGAFKRFENSEDVNVTTGRAGELTPISGSVATDDGEHLERNKDDGTLVVGEEDFEALPREVKRELERRRLSEEEKRIEKAKREWRVKYGVEDDEVKPKQTPQSKTQPQPKPTIQTQTQTSSQPQTQPRPQPQSQSRAMPPPNKPLKPPTTTSSTTTSIPRADPLPRPTTPKPNPNPKPIDARETRGRATLIQERVAALLDESGRQSPMKTAAGYGKYTEEHVRQDELSHTAVKPSFSTSLPAPSLSATLPAPSLSATLPAPSATATATGGPYTLKTPRPVVGSKPKALASPVKSAVGANGLGVSQNGNGHGHGHARADQGTGVETDADWASSFEKRYPSLRGLEMVETEIGS